MLAQAEKTDTIIEDTAWTRRYSGPGNGDNEVTGMVVDARGNTYLTGHTPDATAGEDYVTIKYDTGGTALWVTRFHANENSSDWAQGIALDRNYSTIVTGYSGFNPYYNIETIKYDMAGNPIWTRGYSGIVTTGDYGQAVAVDSSGNIYVAGYSVPVSESSDYWVTLKYDAAGDLKWAVNHYGLPGGDSKATAVATDGRGNVFVGGYFWNGSGSYEDFCTICYDTLGNQKWIATWGGAGGAPDEITNVAATGDGGVCVTGTSLTSNSSSGYSTWETIRYDSTGKQTWAQNYSSGQSLTNGMAVDKEGNVVVVGQTGGSVSSWAIVKYGGSTGNQSWDNAYKGPGNTNSANGVAVDRNGRMIYVTGQSSNAAATDFVTFCYNDSSGLVLWEGTYHSPTNGESYGAAIDVDNAGNVYVSGEVFDTTAKCFDILTMKYGSFPEAAEEKPGPARVNALSLAISPNPSRDGGEVSYALPSAANVSLRLYDVAGSAVGTLFEGRAGAGAHSIALHIPQIASQPASGVYLLRLDAGGQSITRKLVVRE
jgi:hypothetical protein